MNDSLPLRDIHLPEALSWWPPAPGWWLLLLLSLLLVVGLYFLIKYLRRPRLDKLAQAKLKQLLAAQGATETPLELLSQLSLLLRRIGISYLGREVAAGITGRDWYQRLNQLASHAPFSDASIELLCDAPYQAQPRLPAEAIEGLCAEARAWARALPEKPQHTVIGGNDV